MQPESAVPHISLVFREMWDTTAFNPNRSEPIGQGKLRSAHPSFVETLTNPDGPQLQQTRNLLDLRSSVPNAYSAVMCGTV